MYVSETFLQYLAHKHAREYDGTPNGFDDWLDSLTDSDMDKLQDEYLLTLSRG